MKRRSAGGVARAAPERSNTVGDAPAIGHPWGGILVGLSGGRPLRPIQQVAMLEHRIHESRRHVVVVAPTNGGKTLVGRVLLLDAVRRGQRALLVVPLRALAAEQADDLRSTLAAMVPVALPMAPSVVVTTGDYRLDGEWLASPPPAHGEIVVTTPERLDAILRTPNGVAWAERLGAAVIDEAHLVGDGRRGATLELVVASLLTMTLPPRVALLSATVSNPDELASWLGSAHVVTTPARSPLVREVWELEGNESPDEVIVAEARAILADPDAALLVFVFRRASATSLAKLLAATLGVSCLPYHSGLAASTRTATRTSFARGEVRCVVATSALAMGVNLPATHVIVRDLATGPGGARREVGELLQAMGRAGRGDRVGHAAVIVRSSDRDNPTKLAADLASELVAPVTSSLAPRPDRRESAGEPTGTGAVVACLARAGREGSSTSGLGMTLASTLGGRHLVPRIGAIVEWLASPPRHLAYTGDDGQHRLTVLGAESARTMLPVAHASGLGQLVRDLLTLDPSGALLDRWSAFDHLVLTALLSDRAPRFRRFGEDLAERIDAWHEARPVGTKSLFFARWIAGSAATSKADQLLGSLGVGGLGASDGRRRAYAAMVDAIVLDARAHGNTIVEIEHRWGVRDVEGVEEAWRDTAIWLLAGHASVLEVRAFFHHLREACHATTDQVKAASRRLRRLQASARGVVEDLKHCSPLGSVLRGVRLGRAGSGQLVGVATIRTLEEAGIRSAADLRGQTIDDLVALGVQRRFATQIVEYVRRRLR